MPTWGYTWWNLGLPPDSVPVKDWLWLRPCYTHSHLRKTISTIIYHRLPEGEEDHKLNAQELSKRSHRRQNLVRSLVEKDETVDCKELREILEYNKVHIELLWIEEFSITIYALTRHISVRLLQLLARLVHWYCKGFLTFSPSTEIRISVTRVVTNCTIT